MTARSIGEKIRKVLLITKATRRRGSTGTRGKSSPFVATSVLARLTPEVPQGVHRLSSTQMQSTAGASVKSVGREEKKIVSWLTSSTSRRELDELLAR